MNVQQVITFSYDCGARQCASSGCPATDSAV